MVETIRLESGHTLTGIVGSNPTLSAITPNEDCPVCSTNYTVRDHFAEHDLPSCDVESKIGDEKPR